MLLQRLYLSLQPAILDLQTLVTFGVGACHWLLTRGCGIGTCQRNIHVRLGSRRAATVDDWTLLLEPGWPELGARLDAKFAGSRDRWDAAYLLGLLAAGCFVLLFGC